MENIFATKKSWDLQKIAETGSVRISDVASRPLRPNCWLLFVVGEETGGSVQNQ